MCATDSTVPKTKIANRAGSETQFPGKLHDLMEYVERQGLDSVISWIMGGRAFKVHDTEKIVDLLPLFFSQTKYRSFQRQINMWHFDKILDGPDKSGFFHPYFVKGNKALCSKMSRNIMDMPELPGNMRIVSKFKMSKHFKDEKPVEPDKMMTTFSKKLMQNLDNSQFSCNDETDVFAVALHTDNVISTGNNYNTRAENALSFAAIDFDIQNNDLDDGFAGRSFFSVDYTEIKAQHVNRTAQAFPNDLNMASEFQVLPSPVHSIDMRNSPLDNFDWCTPRSIEEMHADRKANQLAFRFGSMGTSVERGPYNDLFADDDASLSYPVAI